MNNELKTITKNVPLTIRVYARSPHRCHPDCPYCEKDVVSSGNYDCTMYLSVSTKEKTMRTDIRIMDLYVAKNVLRDLVCQKNKEKTITKGKTQ